MTRAERPARRGVFVTFEGGEGAGKTTQIRRLAHRLTLAGIDALATREPGGTPIANALRALLVSKPAILHTSLAQDLIGQVEAWRPESDADPRDAAEAFRALVLGPGAPVDPACETLMHYAARTNHYVLAIEPMLKAGRWVLSDRFADSTMAYQGYAAGFGRARVEAIAEAALPGVRPDLTLVLDIDPRVGLERARTSRQATSRYEDIALDYHDRVRAAFLDIARREPERCRVIDAAGSLESVDAAIWDAVRERFVAASEPSAA